MKCEVPLHAAGSIAEVGHVLEGPDHIKSLVLLEDSEVLVEDDTVL